MSIVGFVCVCVCAYLDIGLGRAVKDEKRRQSEMMVSSLTEENLKTLQQMHVGQVSKEGQNNGRRTSHLNGGADRRQSRVHGRNSARPDLSLYASNKPIIQNQRRQSSRKSLQPKAKASRKSVRYDGIVQTVEEVKEEEDELRKYFSTQTKYAQVS